MSARPAGKNWIAILVVCICVVGCAVARNHLYRDLKGVATGQLADQYSVETESKYGVETRKTFHLNYSFEVDGKPYQGKDTQTTEPTAQDCTVYFDPSNPEINALNSTPMDDRAFGVMFALALVAFFGSFPLIGGPRRNEPSPPPPVAGGVGDAAGEYLTMEHGSYDPSVHLIIAFFGQIVLMCWVGGEILKAIAAGHVHSDVTTVCAALVALSYTLWIYWDRSRCIAAYASRFTSGCANITVLYLPILVLLYANYRGFLKLKGR